MATAAHSRRATRGDDARTKAWKNAMKAKIHIALEQLHLPDDIYRAILQGRFGVESSSALDVRGLKDLLEIFRSEFGWQDKPKAKAAQDKHGRPRPLRPDAASAQSREALMAKIEAQLSEKGGAEGGYVPWDYAKAILQRQCGVERLEWASLEQLRGLIAALDKDAKRKGRRRA